MAAEGGPAAEMRASPQAAEIVFGEMHNVLSAMKSNARWFSSQTRTSGAPAAAAESPLLRSFATAKAALLDGGPRRVARDPLLFLRPFLGVVRSEETSGPITGVALTSIIKFLEYGLLDPAAPDAARAAHMIAETTTHCRFEATDSSTDEVVLMKILQVLLACLRSPVGRLLPDDMIYEIVLTGFRMSIQMRLSELLRRVAMRLLVEMVECICKHYRADPLSRSLHGLAPNSAAAAAAIDPAAEDRAANERALEAVLIEVQHGVSDFGPHAADAAVSGAQEPEMRPASDLVSRRSPPLPSDQRLGYVNHRGVQFLQGSSSPVATAAAAVAPPDAAAGAADAALSLAIGPRFGAATVVRLFRFFVDISCPDRGNNSDLTRVLGLQLLATMLELLNTGMPAPCDVLLPVILQDLCLQLLHHMLSEHLSVLALSVRIYRHLFSAYMPALKMQLEGFVLNLCWIATQRAATSAEHRELVLDALHEFLSIPNFPAFLYFNYDCDPQCYNLFERVSNTLNQIVSSERVLVLHPQAHALALESLLACMKFLQSALHSMPSAEAVRRTEEASKQHDRKARLMEGATVWNRSAKEGWAAFQAAGLLSPGQFSPDEMARLIYDNRFLDRHAIGEFLGNESELSQATLRAYSALFCFNGVTLMDALRAYLQNFWLPKESQQIYRVVESFAHLYYEANPESVRNEEDVLMLIYSIVMLNVDLHNPGVTKKMPESKFVSNFRDASENDAFSDEDLRSIYSEIRDYELKVVDLYEGGPCSLHQYRSLCHRTALAAAMDESPEPVCVMEVFLHVRLPLVFALSNAFSSATSEAAQRDALAGMEVCAGIAARYELSDVLDQMVIKLCNASGLLELAPETQNDFIRTVGRDAKLQSALRSAFDLARRHGTVLRDGWNYLLECIAVIHAADMLHLPFVTFDTLVLPSGITLSPNLGLRGATQLSTPQQRRKEARSNSTPSYSFFSWLASGGGDSRVELTGEELDLERSSLLFVDALALPGVVMGSPALAPEAAICLVKACLFAMRSNRKVRRSRESLKFLVDVLAAITLLNRSRVGILWGKLHELYFGLLSQAEEVTGLVRHSVDTLCILLCNVLEADSANESGGALLQDTFGLLTTTLRPELLERILGNLLATTASMIGLCPDVLRWPSVVRLLCAAAESPQAQRQTVVVLSLASAQHCTPQTYASLLAGWKHVVGAAAAADVVQEALQSLYVCYEQCGGFVVAAGAEPPRPGTPSCDGRVNTVAEAWHTFALPVLQEVSGLCVDARPEIRNIALTYLNRALLTSPTAQLPAESLAQPFRLVMFPTVQGLLQLRTRDAGAEESLSRAATLMSKLFLQYMRLPSAAAALPELWFELLGYYEVLAREGGSGTPLSEMVFEALKNVLLVMASPDMQPVLAAAAAASSGGGDFWAQTLARVDPFCPAMRTDADLDAAQAAARGASS